MKKLILFCSFIIVNSTVLFAQSTLLVTDVTNSVTITNGMVIYRTVGALGSDVVDINIKNTSSSTKTYKMRMYYDSRNIVAPGDSANPYYCFAGQCYTPNVFTSPKTETLTPNQDVYTAGRPISVHIEEATTPGVSSIRYRLYETTTAATDVMEFTIKYNDPAASVKSYSSLLSSLSDVYPNPSNSRAFITINTNTAGHEAVVTIANALGTTVYTKNTELSLGKNTISLDIETLSSGIYFATFSSGSEKVVKKFTINK